MTPKTLIIPGWATDYHLLQEWPWPSDNDHVDTLTSQSIEQLQAIIQGCSTPIHIVGFSMGAMIAAILAAENPNKIARCTLISLRPHYPRSELTILKRNLQKNKTLTLQSFYKASIPEAKAWKKFQKIYLPQYQERFSTEALLQLLDILSTLKITQEILEKCPNLRLIHAEKDQIAPLSELLAICPRSTTPQILSQSGHIPFLQKPLN